MQNWNIRVERSCLDKTYESENLNTSKTQVSIRYKICHNRIEQNDKSKKIHSQQTREMTIKSISDLYKALGSFSM